MARSAESCRMPTGWLADGGLAIPGKGIAARVATLAHFRS